MTDETVRLTIMSQNSIDFRTLATDSNASYAALLKYDAEAISVLYIRDNYGVLFVFRAEVIYSDKFVCIILKL